MPSGTRMRPFWWFWIVVLILIVIIYLMMPGTHPPPFVRIGEATPVELAAACKDPKLHFMRFQASEADYDTAVRVRITPEFFSFKNKPEDLERGRVVALVQVLRGTDSVPYGRKKLPYGLKDTIPACMFISGTHPNKLTTTIISKEGERLYTPDSTWVIERTHLLAEAHWQEDSIPKGATRLGFDLTPSALFAESPTRGGLSTAATRLVKRAFKTYGQSSCTNHSCCVSSGGH